MLNSARGKRSLPKPSGGLFGPWCAQALSWRLIRVAVKEFKLSAMVLNPLFTTHPYDGNLNQVP